MSGEIIVPSVGESITEVVVSRWLVPVGSYVAVDTPVVALETDKASVEVPAPIEGFLRSVEKQVEDVAEVGALLGMMEAGDPPEDFGQAPAAQEAAPGPQEAVAMPAAQRVLDQAGLKAAEVQGTGLGGRILKEDAQAAVRTAPVAASAKTARPVQAATGSRVEEAVPMTRMRRTIASRLVEAQNSAALLTTVNEADMSAVMDLRARFKDRYLEQYGIKLGFMSFFVKAVIEGLKAFPALNAEIRGDDVVYKHYFDIGVAVGGGKGLVVPILRNAESMSFADIELQIADFGRRAQAGQIMPDDLTGGTFSISNGGVYGSLLSTPIVNPPQSGILGMHNIVERPVGVDGQVVLRPMMYLAVTYDHRIVDGREAVGFLIRIKECIENPERILLEV
ncbi:MAG: dihydrolipoyllysine-residue succinyltransferase [Rickettsiales bacterium]|nr:dihydrolipoyllysine-residue succinyltransferase [Rickettsiales bacterium]|tara:strand:- start:1494 stop:2672 length:1179 start_codon:yes stop_codon:yes gene_type:complete